MKISDVAVAFWLVHLLHLLKSNKTIEFSYSLKRESHRSLQRNDEVTIHWPWSVIECASLGLVLLTSSFCRIKTSAECKNDYSIDNTSMRYVNVGSRCSELNDLEGRNDVSPSTSYQGPHCFFAVGNTRWC